MEVTLSGMMIFGERIRTYFGNTGRYRHSCQIVAFLKRVAADFGQ